MSNDKRIMGIGELAEYLGMPQSSLYKLSQNGKIPCKKVGRHWKYNREYIDEWITRGGMNDDNPPEYGAQLDAPSLGLRDENDWKRHFSKKQVRSLDNRSIHSVSDLLLLLATNKGKSDLIETLGITPEKLDEIATLIIEEFQSNRTGGTP